MALNPLSARERQLAVSADIDASALQYPTLAALADALPSLPQGRTVLVAGQPMIVDATATGVASAGVDGVRRADRLENLFLAAHFTTQDDLTINISTSIDGINFSLLNSAVLPGGAGFALDGRDPSITWFAGWWWIFITGNSAGSHDFALYRSRDLSVWSKHQIAMQGGPYASNTVPMPGGAAPASAIWAPEPFIENGVMKVMISIRYGADFTNIYGATQQHFRPYVTTLTNLATLTFSAPVAMNFGPGDHSLGGSSRIDPSVLRHNGVYYCAIKDSYYRRIQVYSSSNLVGPWTFIRTLGDGAREIEAPCLTRVRDVAAINGEGRRDKFRIYVDHNRTGPDDPNPNRLVGSPFYFEAVGSPANAFGAMTKMFFDTPVRHGSIMNLADAPVEAAASLAQVAASAGKSRRPAMLTQVALSGGSAWIRPQPDVTYFVDANSGATDLTVRDGPADRFYLAVFSGDAGVGMNVLTAGWVNRGFLWGFGRGNDQVIEMRRRGDTGGYYPVGMARRAFFEANKNNADQNVPAGVDTKLTFASEAVDRGSYYNTTLSRWVPPRGSANISVRATVAGLNTGENNHLQLRKNGSTIAQCFFEGATSTQASGILNVMNEPCSGSDFFEVFLLGNGGSTKVVRGSVAATQFSGECW